MKLFALIFSLFLWGIPLENKQSFNLGNKVKTKEKKSFASFLSNFERVNQPSTIELSELEKYHTLAKGKNISKKMRKSSRNKYLLEYLPIAATKFSRMGPPKITPIHRFYPNENVVAVTYLVQPRFVEAGCTINMALFDLKGNAITKDENGEAYDLNSTALASKSIHTTVFCKVISPNTFLRTTFKNIWEKDFQQFGMQNNEITDYKKENVEHLSIQDDGKILITNSAYVYLDLNN